MTKQQIIDAVMECTQKLGHVPSHNELTQTTAVSRKQIRWHFGSYSRLLRECHLERAGGGYKVDMADLFKDWAALARELKKLPTIAEYEQLSQFSIRPLTTRFGTWGQAPHGLKQFAEEQGWAEEWKDVWEIIEEQGHDVRRGIRRPVRPGPDDAGGAGKSPAGEGPDNAERKKPRHELFGRLMRPGPMICEPTNEQGVIFLFGAMAEKLGFAVLKIRTEYPDCLAFRQVEEDRMELVRIEFEYESRNFLKHMHEASRCDAIVCWRHNWEECPLEVIALSETGG